MGELSRRKCQGGKGNARGEMSAGKCQGGNVRGEMSGGKCQGGNVRGEMSGGKCQGGNVRGEMSGEMSGIMRMWGVQLHTSKQKDDGINCSIFVGYANEEVIMFTL